MLWDTSARRSVDEGEHWLHMTKEIGRRCDAPKVPAISQHSGTLLRKYWKLSGRSFETKLMHTMSIR